MADDGLGGECADGRALSDPSDVVVSPDGDNVYVASRISDAVAVFDRTESGALVQKPGTAGCVNLTGAEGCTVGMALDNTTDLAVSPDGSNVYVASTAPAGGLAIFDRDPGTGVLTQKAGTAGCVTATGSGGACATATPFNWPAAVSVSPDGDNVYVSVDSGEIHPSAVVVFDRDPSGVLTQKAGTAGCITASGSGGTCGVGVAIAGARKLVVSPDGATAYVPAYSLSGAGNEAVAVFDRDGSGVLTQKPGTAGCLTSNGSGGGACASVVAMRSPQSVSVSPDGEDVYVTTLSVGGVAAFDRDGSGVLSQKAGTDGCISRFHHQGACAVGVGMTTLADGALAPDGTSLYVASPDVSGSDGDDAVTVLSRDAVTGVLSQGDPPEVCVADTGAGGDCLDGRALDEVRGVAVSPDGANVYAAAGEDDAVSVFATSAGSSGEISGQVTEAPAEASVAGPGDPIEGAQVVVLDSGFSMVGGFVTDATGHWTASGLPPGDYWLQFLHPPGHLYEAYDDAAWLGEATPVTVTAGDETVADADLTVTPTPGPAPIIGTVTEDGTGDPVEGTWVYTVEVATGIVVDWAQADPAGAYTSGDLDPGTYWLAFLDPAGGHQSEFFEDASNVVVATPVAVQGDPVVVDASLAVATP